MMWTTLTKFSVNHSLGCLVLANTEGSVQNSD